MKLKLVEVDWIDANHRGGWTNLEDLAEDTRSISLLCRTVGYLLVDEKDRVGLLQSLTWSEEKAPPISGDGVMTIPRATIVTIRKLSGGRK